MVYSCKKSMLTMILVFWGTCFWPAQTLMCHYCDHSESCTNPTICDVEQLACIAEIIKIANYTRVRKMCFGSCEEFFHGEVTYGEEINTTLKNTSSEKVREVSHMTNKKTFLFRQSASMESSTICCDNDLCNSLARARVPEDTTLFFGFLLSFMWLFHCSLL